MAIAAIIPDLGSAIRAVYRTLNYVVLLEQARAAAVPMAAFTELRICIIV